MEIKNIQKIERKSIPIGIRTFPSYSEWMKKKNISPTALFNEAIKELMSEK